MKKALLIFLFSASAFFSFGQYSCNLGIDFSFSNNKYAVDGSYSYGVIEYGGSSEFVRKFSNHHAARAFFAYDLFKYRTTKQLYLTILPVRLGYQYFALHDAIVLFADAGVGILVDHNLNSKNVVFSVGSGAGYRLNLRKFNFLHFSANLNYINTDKFINTIWSSFRAAYGLNWNKRHKK